jgi:Tol biopolymer transport system component
VATGTQRELVAKAGEWGRPVVSPDGRTIAFTGYAPTGRSHTVSDLFVIPLTAGGSGSADMRKISGDYDRDPINLRWAPDGSGVYFDADDHGARNIQFASIVGGVKPITTGRHLLTFDSMSKDLVAVGTAADPEHPQDIVKYSLKQPGPVTKLTDVTATSSGADRESGRGHVPRATPRQGWIANRPPSMPRSIR